MQLAADPVSAYPSPLLNTTENSVSAVSWPAIAAGAIVAAAASLLLVAIAAGAGFGALSPWPHAGTSAGAFTAMMAVGLLVVQWLSAGIGGYVTGRLRTKWAGLHTHEVFFRDTAHGLITWATATLLVSAAVAMVAASTAGAAGHAMSAAGAVTAKTAPSSTTIDPYDVDTLLRPGSADTPSAADEAFNDMRVQSTRILAAGLVKGDVPAADQTYLAQVVNAEARVPAAEAKRRVDAMVAKVRADHEQILQAADSARRNAETASLFSALAMLVGAFIACIAAALGGHRRDVHA